jgi:hypothetical protein
MSIVLAAMAAGKVCGGTGAEDGYLGEEKVRNGAAEGTVVPARVKMQKPPFLAAFLV